LELDGKMPEVRNRGNGRRVALHEGARYRVVDVKGNIYEATFVGIASRASSTGAPGDKPLKFREIDIQKNADGGPQGRYLDGGPSIEEVGDIVSIEKIAPVP
jgi:hypothetical protein